MKKFYSNGKLLITGEYLVLEGAKAFALPTKFGQSLIIEPGKDELIHWASYDNDGSIWFKADITFSSVIQKERFGEAHPIKNTIIEILHVCYQMNSEFITGSEGYNIKTELTFPRMWGLGTSSTLINNLAQWLRIDAFELLKRSFGGSGYDIACAQNENGIVYRLVNEKPVVEMVDFKPDFTDKLFFVYLNKKQNSKASITALSNRISDSRKVIPEIDGITDITVSAKDVAVFADALQKHETELSNVLEMETVKEALFPDFKGVVKSLGAWGGDFVLSISEDNPTDYFKARGFETVIPYKDMIL